MNDLNFDELIGGLKKGSADASFREQLLLKSQSTLVRSRTVRHIIRTTVVSSCLLLLVVGAFACGRFTADGRYRREHRCFHGTCRLVGCGEILWMHRYAGSGCQGIQKGKQTDTCRKKRSAGYRHKPDNAISIASAKGRNGRDGENW